jgi:hypothetical protein
MREALLASGRVWTAHEDVARRFHQDREAAQRQVDHLTGMSQLLLALRLCSMGGVSGVFCLLLWQHSAAAAAASIALRCWLALLLQVNYAGDVEGPRAQPGSGPIAQSCDSVDVTIRIVH